MLQYLLITFTIIILLLLISIWIVKSKPNSDAKLSPYECGMNPLGDARHKFRIDYILIGILFIVFDLEVVFLFPYLILFPLYNSIFAYWAISLFILILTIGFIYEFTKGALNNEYWNKS